MLHEHAVCDCGRERRKSKWIQLFSLRRGCLGVGRDAGLRHVGCHVEAGVVGIAQLSPQQLLGRAAIVESGVLPAAQNVRRLCVEPAGKGARMGGWVRGL